MKSKTIRFTALILAVMMLVSMFTACGNGKKGSEKAESAGPWSQNMGRVPAREGSVQAVGGMSGSRICFRSEQRLFLAQQREYR